MSQRALNNFARQNTASGKRIAAVRDKVKQKRIKEKKRFNEGAKVVVQAADRLGTALVSTTKTVRKNVPKKSKSFSKKANKLVRAQKGNKLKW